ncbi:MAG: hypothetical protein OXC29_22415 [Rhodococcus sp.]|nr:hypothetical protein [Rhodococcus sp. (in: high G+C Gram-positive bacteria)]
MTLTGMADRYYDPPEPDFPDGCIDCEGDVDGDRYEAVCIEPQKCTCPIGGSSRTDDLGGTRYLLCDGESHHETCECRKCNEETGCGWSWTMPDKTTHTPMSD